MFKLWRETWWNAKLCSSKPGSKQFKVQNQPGSEKQGTQHVLHWTCHDCPGNQPVLDINICRVHLGLNDHCMIAELLEESSAGTLQMSLSMESMDLDAPFPEKNVKWTSWTALSQTDIDLANIWHILRILDICLAKFGWSISAAILTLRQSHMVCWLDNTVPLEFCDLPIPFSIDFSRSSAGPIPFIFPHFGL